MRSSQARVAPEKTPQASGAAMQMAAGADSAAMGAPHGPAACPPEAAVLPRANLLVLGGDLAYPHPSNETYERRFFRCRHPHAMVPGRNHVQVRHSAQPCSLWAS